MSLIRIRQAVASDASAIQAVLVSSQWFTYADLFPAPYIQDLINNYYHLERIEQEIKSNDFHWHGYIVAEEKGIIIGVIAGGMISEFIGEVYVFYLAPTMRNRGIGTRLLNFLTKIQKHTYGAQEQWVAVAKGNTYGLPFYEARGFRYQHEEQSYGSTSKDQDISLKYKRKI